MPKYTTETVRISQVDQLRNGDVVVHEDDENTYPLVKRKVLVESENFTVPKGWRQVDNGSVTRSFDRQVIAFKKSDSNGYFDYNYYVREDEDED